MPSLRARRLAKRAMDLGGSGLALILLSPLLGLSAVAVRWSMGAPVVFHQDRPGKDGRNIRVHKLRTMSDERDADGELLPDTERLTRTGALLRATSLDELPGLWNVLRGDMSLVGPRPLLHRYTPYLTEEERRRLLVRPGLTGWAQIHGRNDVPWAERLALDVWYVEHWSLRLDLLILLRTVWQVVRREGVVLAPTTTMVDLDDERRSAAVR